MSSLLQSPGRVSHRGVEIFVTLYHTEEYWSCDHCGVWQCWDNTNCISCGQRFAYRFYHREDQENDMLVPWEERRADDATIGRHTKDFDVETISLSRPDGTLANVPKLYRIWRKPCGMFGPWVMFRINNVQCAPDLSVPTRVLRLPRGAEALTEEEAKKYWFTP